MTTLPYPDLLTRPEMTPQALISLRARVEAILSYPQGGSEGRRNAHGGHAMGNDLPQTLLDGAQVTIAIGLMPTGSLRRGANTP